MRFALSLIILISSLLASPSPGADRTAKTNPPNLVIIMADDAGRECFGCYGSQEYQTPNIDRLAANGLRFTNCHSCPLCTPSRVKLMTGQSNIRNYYAFSILPRKEKTGWFSSRLLLGITNAEPDAEQRAAWDRTFILLRYGPVAGLRAATAETWRLTGATLGLLGRMVTGKASVKNLSGPISIAQFANSSTGRGLSNFLFFLGAISLSLGILNLLPVPVLDGGHLMYYLIEWVKGSPVSDRAQMAGQYVGLMALAGLMSLAFFNDILRLIG